MTRERAVEILKALLPTGGSAGIFVESEYEALSFAIQELEKGVEAVKATTVGHFLGPIEHLTGDCGMHLERHWKHCPKCGKELMFPAPPKEETPK